MLRFFRLLWHRMHGDAQMYSCRRCAAKNLVWRVHKQREISRYNLKGIEMSDRYKPNGTPLTEYERELLVILMEECAEVTQAASKLIRFGKENCPENGVPNTTTFSYEAGDLGHMMQMAMDAGLLNREDVLVGERRKGERLAIFMQSIAP